MYDVADYLLKNGCWDEKIIDRDRYDAMKTGVNFDMKNNKYYHIPEIELYNEIKQFYRLFQTEETENRLDKLEKVTRFIEEKIQGDIAIDVLGSTNMGLCQTSSDIDFVLCVRSNPGSTSDLNTCEQYMHAQALLEEILRPDYEFQIMECIDLTIVEKAIREKDYENEMAQRFVAYSALCRPINYRVIAPVEDLLNQYSEFRSELEGSIRIYFRIFINTSTHRRSFAKYESRIKSIGIKIPDSIQEKIKAYLHWTDTSGGSA